MVQSGGVSFIIPSTLQPGESFVYSVTVKYDSEYGVTITDSEGVTYLPESDD